MAPNQVSAFAEARLGGGEPKMVLYKISSTYLIMAAWPSGYSAAFCAHDSRRGYGSILAHKLFFLLYNSNKGKHWNPLESVGICWNSLKCGNSNGFQQIPTDSNGNHSWRLPDSTWFQWIPSDSIGNSMEWKTKMAEAPAKWILSEFHGIPTFQLESAGFRQNSWGRVKTSCIGAWAYS